MLDNQGYQDNLMGQPILAGTSVYDVNGDKVGEVSDRGLQRNALIVHKGLIFHKDLYIPLDAIRGRDADGVHLNVAKGDISSHNWDRASADMDDAVANNSAAADAVGEDAFTEKDIDIPVMGERPNVSQPDEVIQLYGATPETTEANDTSETTDDYGPLP